MRAVFHDTWASLPIVTRPMPAVTLPVPAVPPSEGGHLRNRFAVQPTPAAQRASVETVRTAEAARWSAWGAARTGARTTLLRRQTVGLAALGIVLMAALLANLHTVLICLLVIATGTYLVAGIYKSLLLLRGERMMGAAEAHADERTTAASAGALADDDLPLYTVLVPLHREGRILPALVRRLAALDYPTDRLEVLLLVESDDDETHRALAAFHLPPHIRPITVPAGLPRTKPRALNVGLARAGGEFIVVYDAEDCPDPDQLRRAVASFRSLPRRVVCVQARLNFYNMRQSLLASLFAVDYVQWYYMLLPGLTRSHAFVPLGGTSNHFRIEALRRLGGWDPYNVTEDCDLGARIARANLDVAMLDSTTWEEAVTRVPQWVKQRSRWVKGYIQTYLVHMRDPHSLWREIGPRGFFDFQALVGGSSLMLLANPLMWLLTLLYVAANGTPLADAIRALFPPALYYPSLLCFIFGNFIFFYTSLYVCVRHGYYGLARYALLSPLYWVLMSIGAWVGFISLIRNPHYWAKTEHGVSLSLGNGTQSAPDWQSNSVDSPALGGLAAAYQRTVASATDPRWQEYSLSVVLPAHNEEAIIGQTVRTVIETLASWKHPFEVIVVDDGSRDRTGEIVEEIATSDERVRLVTHPVNQGYGAALVTGFSAATNTLTFFMDSDGQFDIHDLQRFFPLLAEYDAILGYRINRQDTLMRKMNARGWKMLIRIVFGVRVRDIDCAFKLFHTNFFREHPLETRGAMINTEMIYKFSQAGLSYTQVGVEHLPRRSGRATGAKVSVILKALTEMALYGWRWRLVSAHHSATPLAAQPSAPRELAPAHR